MDKKTIIAYLRNELTANQTRSLLDWVESSEANRRYFNTVTNLWTALSLEGKANVEPDFADLEQRIMAKLSPEQNNRKRILHTLTRVAAVLLLPVALGLAWLLYEQSAKEALVQTEHPQITVYAPLCARVEMDLPDGTKVWLNSGSKLTYPRLFEGDFREVSLEGEAYFDVHKNKEYPFIVKTHQLHIKATGTTFNVRAYTDDDDTETTLVEGAVELSGERWSHKATPLKPGQVARVHKDHERLEIQSNVNTELYTAWKEGVLVFNNVSINELAKRLERWYGVNITIEENNRILDNSYTGKFKEETIRQVLEMIKQTSNINYRIEEKNVLLFSTKL